MPKAMLKIKIVDGFKAMPVYPIIPAVMSRGMMLGGREIAIIRREGN